MDKLTQIRRVGQSDQTTGAGEAVHVVGMGIVVVAGVTRGFAVVSVGKITHHVLGGHVVGAFSFGVVARVITRVSVRSTTVRARGRAGVMETI